MFANIPPKLAKFSQFYSKMAKPKVYLTRKINEDALETLKKRCDVDLWTGNGPVPRNELLKNIQDKQALFCMLSDTIDEEILHASKVLKVITTMSVGYDHLDLKAIKKRNIKVGYTPNVLTEATAELTIALLLATSRRLFEANRAAREGQWAAWSPFWMCGPGLAGSTVGIVGFGRIGQEVGQIIKGFKPAKILFSNRSEKKKEAEEIGARQVPFETLLRESDFVIATLSFTPETRHLFDEKAFGLMKESCIFINTSRGLVVDQEALIRALEKGSIRAAGLDVMTPEPLPTDNKLFQLENCTILPHIASATIETRNVMAQMCVENIIKALDGEKMPGELLIPN